ncbi:uncharacterized protein LOC116203897 [Punica granatum]|uniref:Uncharacterized protein LOC116203897 n=1 Tax=Punica granatum TaxID=22663 RepID=A0A6P8DAX6_PUNGR|nr:uncharacterized protein LOC116203897 [Punica granatum]
MRCSGPRSIAADSDSTDCSGYRKRAAEAWVSDSFSDENNQRKCTVGARAAVVELTYVGAPLISKSAGCPCDSVQLEPGRVYTIGRSRRLCDFLLNLRRVSRQHCKIVFDSSSRKIFIVDGVGLNNCLVGNENGDEEDNEEEKGRARECSLNGVSVNGVRCNKGELTELSIGDVVSLVCVGDRCDSNSKIGFVIRKIVYLEEEGGIFPNHGDFDVNRSFSPQRISSSASSSSKRIFASRTCAVSLGSSAPILRAKALQGQCRHILRSADPISCILRCPIYFRPLVEAPLACNNFPGSKVDLIFRKPARPIAAPRSRNVVPMDRQELLSHVISNNGCNRQASFHAERLPGRANAFLNNNGDDEKTSSLISAPVVTVPNPSESFSKKARNDSCRPTLENKFCLNRLGSAAQDSVGHGSDISLPELLYPVQTILRIFVATFTSDIKWFLSYCQIPRLMPVTIACHDTERCWSSSPDKRTLSPFPEFPNVEVVFPPFPESIAFGNDRKKQGIACHHPKLFVLQREDRIRVIITSANLVAKQWISITNTVWWQDFPQRSPDYMSLFTRIINEGRSNQASNCDFAAQLAGFIASLVIDDPCQAHWITELMKYDFQGASGYLIASVPGIHSYGLQRELATTTFSMDDQDTSCSWSLKLLTRVEASVVGLGYFFRTASDSNGAALKKLAAFLSNSRVNASGLLEIVLRRNTNVAADPNAVSVLVCDPNNSNVGDCIQFGFLPRTVAKWVSPLWDGGFFRFSGYISPKEVLAAALGGDNKRVQLILHVFQGPSFPDMAKMINHEHTIALCSLIASMDRCIGLSRLHEVVAQYSWPESLETDFVYAASSIGSSISPQFLAAFSAASGKKSVVLSESEESDPEWGRWTASQELKNPSVGIVFPTIERVQNAVSGISPSRQILCFSERTWQKLKPAGILRDAVPHPHQRIGHPMHIKVARRRFKSEMGTSSGWVYSGSHNFSAAAWGRLISSRSDSKAMKLHVCNYELGILLVVPPGGKTCGNERNITNLDDIRLPFIMPAPKYVASDRPATKQAMREAAMKLNILESELTEVPQTEVVDEIPEEEELVEPVDRIVENDEDRAYANMLWSEVDSSQSS